MLVKKCVLQLELAAIVDAGESLVKATYILEGDGPMVFTAYELINTILLSIHTAHFPNLTSQLSANDSSAQQQLVTYGRACVDPGFEYLLDMLTKGALKSTLGSSTIQEH